MMLHLENSLSVLPFTSSREVPSALFLPTNVPVISSSLPYSQSLLPLCRLQPKARIAANFPFLPSLYHHPPTATHRCLARWRFIYTDGSAFPSPVGVQFVSDSPSPSCRYWLVYGRHGQRVHSLATYSTHRSMASPHGAQNPPASDHLAFSVSSPTLHRPCFDCADSVYHRCGHTCSALAWFTPSRCASACQHSSCYSRDTGFILVFEQYSHSDWAHEQRAESMCDAAIPNIFLGSPSVLRNDLLLHLAPHERPQLSEVCSLADVGRLPTDDVCILLLAR